MDLMETDCGNAASQSEAMDPQIWSQLCDHDEILRLILFRLSWRSNLQLRRVSKEWKATLSEPPFLTWKSMLSEREHLSNSSFTQSPTREEPGVCILSTTENRCAVVDFPGKSWNYLPDLQLDFGKFGEFVVSGAAEGLILLESNVAVRATHEDLHSIGRFLFNPLNNSWRKLPPVPKVVPKTGRRPISLDHPLTLTVDENRNVKVIAFEFVHMLDESHVRSRNKRLRRIYIYDVLKDSWELHTEDTGGSSQIEDVERHLVFAGNELFIQSRSLDVWNPRNRVFQCLKSDFRNVNLVVATRFSSRNRTLTCLRVMHIFQHRGVLRMLGTVDSREKNYLYVCEYHQIDTWLWDDKIEMPQNMVEKLFSTLRDEGVWRIYFDSERDCICLGNRFISEHYFMCNLETKEWTAGRCSTYEGQNSSNQKIYLWLPRDDVVL